MVKYKCQSCGEKRGTVLPQDWISRNLMFVTLRAARQLRQEEQVEHPPTTCSPHTSQLPAVAATAGWTMSGVSVENVAMIERG